ncbi:unnamed protein product [Amoebophrya sp. A120]|nr:unnamed protein product [Amoebophrya sp. A120]|eukprot:GSA120T00010021001.1
MCVTRCIRPLPGFFLIVGLYKKKQLLRTGTGRRFLCLLSKQQYTLDKKSRLGVVKHVVTYIETIVPRFSREKIKKTKSGWHIVIPLLATVMGKTVAEDLLL